MADTGTDAVRGVTVCDNKCGCAVPWAGGSGCRCTSDDTASGGREHVTCSCGQHCKCNPCSCPKTVVAGTGCRCGPDCTCASCRT